MPSAVRIQSGMGICVASRFNGYEGSQAALLRRFPCLLILSFPSVYFFFRGAEHLLDCFLKAPNEAVSKISLAKRAWRFAVPNEAESMPAPQARISSVAWLLIAPSRFAGFRSKDVL